MSSDPQFLPSVEYPLRTGIREARYICGEETPLTEVLEDIQQAIADGYTVTRLRGWSKLVQKLWKSFKIGVRK